MEQSEKGSLKKTTWLSQENSESDIYVEATRGIGRNTVIGQYLDIDQSQLPKIFRPIPVVVST